MGKGKDRNQECWCGSGKKYKKCHLGREREKSIRQSDIEKNLKKIKSRKTCMAPDNLKHECTQIIHAHTISKSCNLKKIADEKNNLLTYVVDAGNIETNTPPSFKIKKVGINKASTYQIFCSKHDKDFFFIIEDREFVFSDEQVFMLSYRNLCYELYLKENIIDINRERRRFDGGKELEEQLLFQCKLNANNQGASCGVRDLETQKNQFDKLFIKRKFNAINYYAIIIDQIPQFMGSCIWCPTLDFYNNRLANLLDTTKIFNSISASVITLNDDKGAIIFSWLKLNSEDKHCLSFVASLNSLSNDEKAGAILKWFFASVENLYFQEKWWDSLDTTIQEKIKGFMCESLISFPTMDCKEYSNLSSILGWNILEIKHNLNFLK